MAMTDPASGAASTASGAAARAARVMERAWDILRAPVHRVCGRDIPVPYAEPLEAAWLPGAEDVRRAAHKLMDNRPGERGGRDDVHT